MKDHLSTVDVISLVKQILRDYKPEVQKNKETVYLDLVINNQLVLLLESLRRMDKHESS